MSGPGYVCHSDRTEQLDKRVNLLFISRSLDDHLRVRNVHHFRAKDTHETQDLLPFRTCARGHSYQSHLALDVWPRRYILHFTHAREPFALFDDLVDRAVITTCDDRYARPSRIKTLADGDRLNIETARTKQSDDPRQLSRLIRDDY